MTTLTLAKLAEIEQAAAKATPGPWRNTGVKGEGDGAHFAVGSPSGIVAVVHGSTVTEVCNTRDMISQCDPATVAALCRVARAAVAISRYSTTGGPSFADWDQKYGELDASLRAAGLIA